jgi:hypothetical protein
MKVNTKVLVCCIVCLVFVGVASGAAFVFKTVQTYSGACDKLDGFPGVLQEVGFVPKGDCKFVITDRNKDRDKDDCPPHACEVKGKEGICTFAQRDETGKPSCFCKVKKVSRDEDDDRESK